MFGKHIMGLLSLFGLMDRSAMYSDLVEGAVVSTPKRRHKLPKHQMKRRRLRDIAKQSRKRNRK